MLEREKYYLSDMPRPKKQIEEVLDFRKLSIGQVEGLVGRKAYDVRQEGNWIKLFFNGPAGVTDDGLNHLGAGLTISFRKW